MFTCCIFNREYFSMVKTKFNFKIIPSPIFLKIKTPAGQKPGCALRFKIVICLSFTGLILHLNEMKKLFLGYFKTNRQFSFNVDSGKTRYSRKNNLDTK